MTRAFLSLGFRPFYLGAAAFAALAVPAWYAAFAGWMPVGTALSGLAWHAHEMLFGFAPAVIGGFLLTAVRAWTGRSTVHGTSLAGLFGLWLAARVLMATGPWPLAVLADLLFLPLLALSLAVPLWRARNRRNAFVVVLLLALGALSAAHHGAYRGWVDPLWAERSPTVAMDLVAVLLTVIGGRIIPTFSANAIATLTPRRWRPVEALAILLPVLVALVDVGGLGGLLPMGAVRALFALTALIQLIRWLGWQPWATRGNALLLVLPLGYLWLPIHLALRGWLDVTPGVMAPLALHALAVGAMAGLMLAMMSRSARGHTGRPLIAEPTETLMFTAVHLAAVCRVAGPLLWPTAYLTWVQVAALLWLLAFALFTVRYAPMVVRPRLDVPG